MQDKNEFKIESQVISRLRHISEKIEAIQKQKSVESKCASDCEAARTKYKSAQNSTGKSIDPSKIEQYKDEMDECETRLEKERDIYVSVMYDLLAEEDAIIQCIMNYVELQRLYFLEAMEHMTVAAQAMQNIKGRRPISIINS